MIFNIEKIQADLEKFTQLQEEELALAKTTAVKSHSMSKLVHLVLVEMRLLKGEI